MKPEKSSSHGQLQFLAPTLREMLDPQNPLYKLSEKIDWKEIEAELSPRYVPGRGAEYLSCPAPVAGPRNEEGPT